MAALRPSRRHLRQCVVALSLAHGQRGVFVGDARRLIPVYGGGIEQRPVVAVVFFDARFEAVLEGNVIGDVPPRHGEVAGVGAVSRLALRSAVENLRCSPGVAEVVFRAGAECRGELLAVHEELLVALAPPVIPHHIVLEPLRLGTEFRNLAHVVIGQRTVPDVQRVPDMQGDAAEAARAAVRQEHGPVRPAVLCVAAGAITAPVIAVPLGVEAQQTAGQLRKAFMGNRNRDCARHGAVIGQTHDGLVERHVPGGVHSVLCDAGRQGPIRVETGAGTEEVAERRPDAWRLLAIPVTGERDLAQRLLHGGRLRLIHGTGDAGDRMRTVERDNVHCFSRRKSYRLLNGFGHG